MFQVLEYRVIELVTHVLEYLLDVYGTQRASLICHFRNQVPPVIRRSGTQVPFVASAAKYHAVFVVKKTQSR